MFRKLTVVVLLAAAVGIPLALTRGWGNRAAMEALGASAWAGDAYRAKGPEFPPGIPWVQSEPRRLADLRGRVVIVHFWTFGCINCIHNYPVYKAWQEKYAGKEVTIIGVHTPEFTHEADVIRVRAKARENGLKFPIAIDNESRIWKSWNNHAWPSIYLVDKKGQVRYRWDGELHSRDQEGRQFASRIDELLAEKP
jgi:thiol-disulfide isomerase/thioredoxin